MILDILDNADQYAALHPRFGAAFAFLRKPDLAELPEGRLNLVGDSLYAVVVKGPGRTPENAFIETHDHYIDIQFVLEGKDSIGWKARCELGPATEASDPRSDVQFYKDAPTVWSEVNSGMLGIYFPEDAHMPMISDNDLHKVIVKVRIED